MIAPRSLVQAIRQAGGVDGLPEVSGPTLDAFDPRQVAQAIKGEVARTKVNGGTRISLHMDLEDALMLARALEVR